LIPGREQAKEKVKARSSGVQEFRSSGVQEFRSSGVQEFKATEERRRLNFQPKNAQMTDRNAVFNAVVIPWH
jgi:hypothetical protein